MSEREKSDKQLDNAQITAARQMLKDGAMFQECQQMLLSWFAKKHDIIFAETPTGRWVSKNRTKRGTQRTFDSFHEMLIANIEAVSNVANP